MDVSNLTKYFLVYKITNNKNNKIYIGIHETYNINDTYMGSGIYLKRSISKHGIENFSKEILHIFDNKEEMLNKEKEMVNEDFIKRKDTYNVILGGGFNTSGFANVKDKDGNNFLVDINDPKYLNGEYVGITKGFVNVKDKDGNFYQVSINDERYLNGELVSVSKGLTTVKDKEGNNLHVSVNDSRYLNGELLPITTGFIVVKDKDGNCFQTTSDDERYLNGELVCTFTGKKHTDEAKKKIGEKSSIRQKGDKNSQFGTCWIYNLDLKTNKKIKKEETENYINDGWILGMNVYYTSIFYKVTEEMKKEMQKYYDEGNSSIKTAKKFNLGITTVLRYIKTRKKVKNNLEVK